MNIVKCDCSNGLTEQGVSIAMDAAEELSKGNLIVYPTETVYGIGSDIYDEVAIKNLFLVKKRPFDMALSVAVSDKQMMEKIAVLDENAEKLVKAFMPGPLTLIVPKQPGVSDMLTAMSQKVGIRIPDHPMALEIVKRHGPIVATSANIHSKPDAVTIEQASEDFGDLVNLYIDAGKSPTGRPSTIVWLMDGQIEIVRQGDISVDQIEEVLRC